MRALAFLLLVVGCGVGVVRPACDRDVVTERGRLTVPVGAELAVAQHLQDLLLTAEGRTLLEAAAQSDDAIETENLATFLAESLINGVEVDVQWAPPTERRRRSWSR